MEGTVSMLIEGSLQRMFCVASQQGGRMAKGSRPLIDFCVSHNLLLRLKSHSLKKGCKFISFRVEKTTHLSGCSCLCLSRFPNPSHAEQKCEYCSLGLMSTQRIPESSSLLQHKCTCIFKELLTKVPHKRPLK